MVDKKKRQKKYRKRRFRSLERRVNLDRVRLEEKREKEKQEAEERLERFKRIVCWKALILDNKLRAQKFVIAQEKKASSSRGTNLFKKAVADIIKN